MNGIPPRLAATLADRYRIEGELGAGGMATVYLAEDLKHGRRVAIKVLRPELAAVIGADRFLAEIRTTANLQHPHILALFDSGEADGFLYYVMPYVEGESLRDRLDREGPLPVNEAVRIAMEAADALDYAHRQGVLHRDIKPANLLLHEGRVLVADFGIALALSAAGGGRLTETGLSLGTPHYMSPEQASADRDPGPRSDLYSLACVLYEMLAGQPPHTGPSAQAVLVRILTGDPEPLTALRPNVPPNVAQAVSRALEKLPADRFSGPAGLAEALADPAFRHGAPSGGAGRTGAQGRGSGAPAARWVVPALAGLLLVTMVVAAVGWLRGPGEAPRSPVRLALPLQGYEVLPGNFDVAPDGSVVVLATEAGLVVRPLDAAVTRVLPGTAGASSPEVSPNGRWIAFSQNGDIRRTPIEGGEVTTLLEAPGAQGLYTVSVGADGSVVALGPDGYFLLEGGASEPRNLVGIDPDIRGARFLPDGSAFLFSEGGDAIKLFDPATDSVWDLGLSGQRPRYASGYLMAVSPAGALFAAPFDLGSRRVTGRAVTLEEGVQVDVNLASFAASATGVLVLARGSAGWAPDVQLVYREPGSGEPADTIPLPLGLFEDGRFSPDGTRLALEVRVSGTGVRRSLEILDLETLARTQLTFDGDNHHPRWSSDGRFLAFASERDGTLDEDVWIKAVDGTIPPRSIWTAPGDQHPFAWPSDSLIIAGNPELGLSGGLRLLSLGDEVRELATLGGEWFETWMEVSPDGRFAAYESDELGDGQEVFVRSFPPTAGGKWRISEGGGREPRWAPDGDLLYYRDPDGWLVEARLRWSPAPAVLARRRVLDLDGTTFWDVDPRDGRILVGRVRSRLGEDATAAGSLDVLLNWPAALEERAGPVGGREE